MIIKSLSRSDQSFTQLLGYLTRAPHSGTNPEKALDQTQKYGRDLAQNLFAYLDKDQPTAPDYNPTILYNLDDGAISPQSIIAQFKTNAELLPERRNGVTFYHEILSFHKADTPNLSHAIMEDLTRQYLAMRAPRALAVAKCHFDTGNKHVHIMISSNDLGKAKRNRLSKAEFKQIKYDLETYQYENFPLIIHSFAQPAPFKKRKSRKLKDQLPNAEQAAAIAKTAADKLSRKELQALILHTLTLATSNDEFLTSLNEVGFELVRRGNTLTLRNDQTKQRARLSTLGVLDKYQDAQTRWEKLPERMEVFKQQNEQRQFRFWREEGFAARMMAAIAPIGKPFSKIGKRLAKLKNITIRRFFDRDRD